MGKTWRMLRPVIAVALGLGLGSLITLLAGENPLNVLRIIFGSAFGSTYDLGMTLFYATPLIFTGLSVAAAFHAGLFNIGAEGQLTLGALAAAAVGIVFPELPWPASIACALSAAFFVGALWGMIPGMLKAYRGSHEVITTIMLNFVAAGIASWVTLYLLRNTESQNPETLAVGTSYLLVPFSGFGGAPVNRMLIFAVLSAGMLWFCLQRTRFGYELRAVGQGEAAATTAGIDVRAMHWRAMALAGGIAGLAGLTDILGAAGRFKLGFSADYGFMGIAVALLSRNKPIPIIFSAFLFAALHKGASDLDFETENVTKDLAVVLQACVILMVCADGIWDVFSRSPKTKKGSEA